MLTVRRGKAVANGAVSFLLDHLVSMRVARTTFGTDIHHAFDPSNAQHRLRSGKVVLNSAGEKLVPQAFDVILAKVGQVTGLMKHN